MFVAHAYVATSTRQCINPQAPNLNNSRYIISLKVWRLRPAAYHVTRHFPPDGGWQAGQPTP